MEHVTLLGIDLGTTVLKAGVFDATNGRLLAQASRRLPVRQATDGGQELRAAAIDRAFRCVANALRNTPNARWERVVGVGIAAQGGSSLIAERATGLARTDMILWNDARTRMHTARLAAETDARFWNRFVLSGAPPAGLGRLVWMREQQPGLFHDGFIHIGAGELLFHRLTGVWRQDAGNAIQIGSYNARTCKLDPAAFDLVDVPLSFVAPLRRGHETSPLCAAAARRLGLRAGIPVAGPYIDQEACYMAALGAAERPLQCSFGTAWVGNFELPRGVRGDSPTQIVLPGPAGGGRLVIQPLLTGNTAWDWALTTFLDADHGVALRKAAKVFAQRILPPDGLVCVPWCAQPNPLDASAYGAGTFHGVSTQTTKEDLVRATAAGLVFEFGRVFSDVRTKGVVDAVVLYGGASKAPYYRELAAAMFAPIPVLWQRDYDVAAARGALYALNPSAVRGTVEPVSVNGLELDAVKRGYDAYNAVFSHTHGGISSAGPFRCSHKTC